MELREIGWEGANWIHWLRIRTRDVIFWTR